MSPLDILWHLLNLFLPALGMGLLAPALAKLLWRRELKGVAFTRLALWCGSAAALCVLGALVAFGRDGRMSMYVAVVVATSFALWWAGFGPGRRVGR